MFDDPAARRAWRHFRLRVELMLSSVSSGVRRELVDDLAAHVRDMVAHGPASAGENDRLQAALDRLGDPRDFLAPLIGEAIFRDPRRDIALGQTGRAMLSLASRGWHLAWRSASVLLAALLGAVAMLVSVASLLDSATVGLFRLGPDDVQLRLLGGRGGVPLFAPWLALGLLGLAAVSLALSWRQARKLVLDILINRGSGK